MTSDSTFNCWNVFAFNLPRFPNKISGKEVIQDIRNAPELYEFKLSPFFKSICTSIETKGWVDIEHEYYDMLLNCIDNSEQCKYSTSQLNEQMDYIRKILAEYLLSLQPEKQQQNNALKRQIISPIKNEDICIAGQGVYHEYISNFFDNEDDYRSVLANYGYNHIQLSIMVNNLTHAKNLLVKYPDIAHKELNNIIFPIRILLLNFNYTYIGDQYADLRNIEVNHIHGELNQPEGMIFGYGDELDDEYKRLLKQADNKYLDNIKSIKYLETNNYRNTLRFIESAPFQVYIMGHSCGMSDRTLLNTLFEHKNCVSIKPFFYQKNDGSDNYMRIVQNICRNFSDMKLFRDKVVCKTNCIPMPQCSQEQKSNTEI